MTESTNNQSEHVHEWWYQPANPADARLFASRQERGDYWYCNVGDHNGSIHRHLDSGCRVVSFSRPEGATNGPR